MHFDQRGFDMRALILSALLATSLVPQAAPAFSLDGPTSFRGFRVEGNIGGDRFSSLGTHDTKMGYGATIGFDGVIGDHWVIGAEGTYWRAHKWSENCVPGVYSGSVCSKSFQEYGSAARLGYLVTPKLLVFGKGGWVTNEQRQRFDPLPTLLYINGQIVGPQQAYYRHFNSDGYQVGGGLEYSLTRMFYVDAQYVYSNYEHHTRRQRAMLGVGVRF